MVWHGHIRPLRRLRRHLSQRERQVMRSTTKKPLAPGARIKLCLTRTDSRVVIAMTVPHHYLGSCGETRPQGSTGGSPSGEGRSVKKICLWHIFSVGRSGYAASKPWFLWRIVRGGLEGGEGNRNPSPPITIDLRLRTRQPAVSFSASLPKLLE